MLSFFPLDVLDEIWNVIESVSEGFLTYSSVLSLLRIEVPGLSCQAQCIVVCHHSGLDQLSQSKRLIVSGSPGRTSQ